MMQHTTSQRDSHAHPAWRPAGRLAGTIVLAAVAVALAAGPAAAWPRAATRHSTVSAASINCPPPNPKATAGGGDISDC